MSFNPDEVKEITVQDLKKMRDEGKDFQLIDVREKNEFDVSNLGGELIPLGEVKNNVNKFKKDTTVVVHCRSGRRSATAIMELQKKHGFTNLVNLKGGILAWIDEIDPSLPKG